MKIAYFIGTLRVEDGVAKVLLRMAEYAVNNGHKAVIITGYVEPEVHSPVPVWTIPSVVFPLYKDYRLPLPGDKGFKKKLEKFKPDILHVHSPDTIAWAALKYAKEHKLPIMATHHTAFDRYLPYYHLGWAAPILWTMLRRLYTKLAVVTSPSPTIADELKLHGISNTEVYLWGTNLKLFNPEAYSADYRKKLCPKTRPLISSISRLTWEKDLKILAETYKLLRKKLGKDGFCMVVAGEGPAATELKKMMPDAIFKGHLNDGELQATYASSDIFLFPSHTETFGLVALEAMASGAVPVVANSGGSLAIVQHNKNGLLAEAMNPKDFAKKTLYLLEHPEKRKQLRETGIAYAKNYDWSVVLKNFFKLYKRLTND